MQTIRFNKLEISEGSSVLDMGCGEGRHTIGLFVEKQINAFGFDLSLDDLNIARSRLDDFSTQSSSNSVCVFGVSDINNMPFQDGSYDSVICSEVLEHVPAPEESIKELIRVLKPGGVLALSVPRFLPEWICWQLSEGYQQMPGGHVRIFKHKTLKQLATNEGMSYQGFHWAHGLHSPYWWLQCLFWNNRDSSYLIKLYHKFLVWDLMKKPIFTRILEFILQPLIGKSLVMYFKKPLND
jgi:SAM-dependent methyltransferase|tara:strand:- start:1761 stop:2477 length:717 start_codon:yes stop_codon:yes gene_type:complete